MKDYGKHERERFLREEAINKRHLKQAYWLLIITSTYVIIHMGLYIWSKL